jgi:hypothetical protein
VGEKGIFGGSNGRKEGEQGRSGGGEKGGEQGRGAEGESGGREQRQERERRERD